SLSPPRREAPEAPTNDGGRNLVGAMGPFAPETAVYGQLGIHFQSVHGSSSSQGLGGYFWMQVAHRTINNNQSTHLVTADAYAGSTQSALAIRLGVERAMVLAGANPANITPMPSPFLVEVAPGNAAVSMQLVPGRHYVNVPGFGAINDGSDMMAVTICREVIRYLGSADMNALRIPPNAEGAFNNQTNTMFPEGRPEWVNGWNRFRNEIMYSFARQPQEGGRQMSALEGIAPMPGAEELSENILNALRELLRAESYTYGNINQANRLGHELVPSPFRQLP
ncbi:MAG: hypothetical protein FWC67_01050, partial [Defluviitaleaceae bacterium]|nr:hypothetical protein [Defluviitaleaceae bacterium]